MRTVRIGRGLFAIASASLAIWSFAYGDFAAGGLSLPHGSLSREVWIYGSALILLAASAGLCLSRSALPSVLTIVAYDGLWAVTAVPQILSKPLSVDAWYPFCEALTSLVGAWILYTLLRRPLRASQMPIAGEGAVHPARILFGLTCVFYGWSHFVYADYTASMVPTWLPGHLVLAYFTGAAHVGAGIAIILAILPRLAAILEAIMMSLFGLLVWVPSFFVQPRPTWATPTENQWSELVVSLLLAASAWMVAISLRKRSWTFG